ncbi:MAG: urate hydroxylase PuuD, partial [Bdellovibrionales bacterium]|nr:urate hydroxylase PuuD [Oligoflexia bacterium]
MTLFSGAAAEFWMRWVHYFFGLLWIGHLFYFNFSQMAFMAEATPATKSEVTQKLTPRTMFWFRWGAMVTFLSGWAMIGHKMGLGIPATSAWGTIIFSGSILGTVMFLNVWLVIWPNNKIMIDNATKVAKGEAPVPGIAELASRASIGSRTNTLFAIPMLFFMTAASHLPLVLSPE